MPIVEYAKVDQKKAKDAIVATFGDAFTAMPGTVEIKIPKKEKVKYIGLWMSGIRIASIKSSFIVVRKEFAPAIKGEQLKSLAEGRLLRYKKIESCDWAKIKSIAATIPARAIGQPSKLGILIKSLVGA